MRRLFHTESPAAAWRNAFSSVHHAGASSLASDYLVKILSANIYDVAHETPLSCAPNLSSLIRNNVYLKREDTQPVFSFKIRGAANKISSLGKDAKAAGVVTCSAGNHAQGVALTAARMGIKATIVMPEATPRIKVDAVRRFGGDYVKVLLHGKNYDEASNEAKRIVYAEGLTMIHPFDDPWVIAGQGTIGQEILKVPMNSSCSTIHQTNICPHIQCRDCTERMLM